MRILVHALLISLFVIVASPSAADENATGVAKGAVAALAAEQYTAFYHLLAEDSPLMFSDYAKTLKEREAIRGLGMGPDLDKMRGHYEGEKFVPNKQSRHIYSAFLKRKAKIKAIRKKTNRRFTAATMQEFYWQAWEARKAPEKNVGKLEVLKVIAMCNKAREAGNNQPTIFAQSGRQITFSYPNTQLRIVVKKVRQGWRIHEVIP